MRDRLIELLSDFYYLIETMTRDDIDNIADHLLGNGVIVPPCDFLQKCYVLPTIENGLSEMTEMKCIGFMLSHDSYVANLVDNKNKLYQPCFGRFGKTVFLTREEAEQALKGGEG